jgi:predicted ATPase/anti-anti-sigma regulatory factor
MATGVAGYRVEEQIHEGRRSVVYRATRLSDGKPVILKTHRSPYPHFAELAQYQNQYAIAKDLDVPGVVRPTALEAHGNGFALVMEDTGSISLKEYAGGRALAPEEALRVGLELARTLEELHAHRVIHKDIKASNILIHPESKQILITDFSIATPLLRENQEGQRSNALEGTLSYISPEQTGRMSRWIDGRSDYYSLGVTLYELLTGTLPFDAEDSMELIHCHIARRPEPPIERNRAAPPAASDIVMKLLEKAPEARYQSAAGLAHDLKECLERLRITGSAPSFPLGQKDVSSRFTLPETLYGREAELDALMRAFERVSGGATELLLVAGSSGIGKSALVHEMHKPIVRRRGYFVSGKFDQFKRNVPFSSLVQAFRDLVRQVLTESAERIEGWKARLTSAVADSGKVIVDVIPEVLHLIGPQPPVSELSPADNQDRFNRIFQRFIRVFAAAEHPLVVFLDDLQWADSASLKLLHLLLSDKETGHLLVMGAYRDNEVGPAHPLLITVDKISGLGVPVTNITLLPLDFKNLNLFVADTLRRAPEETVGLTELVMGKTRGNPFFASQYLKSLYQDGLIQLDAETGRFNCDLKAPRLLTVSDDVVEFMTLQIQKLPAETQEALRLAAAIGNQFDLATLAVAYDRPQPEAAAHLWRAVEEGLVLPVDETYKAQASILMEAIPSADAAVTYKFLHDRVQQAAYQTIPPGERPKAHLRIGRTLLLSTPASLRDEKLFDIVNQLNAGAALISDAAERDELTRLNLAAGMKAKASTAYTAAARYLATATDLLPADVWDAHYDLALTLHKARAEVEYLEGSFDVSEGLIRSAFERVRTPIEKAELLHMLIVQYTLRAKYPEAIETGRTALRLVGIELPEGDFEAARDAEIAEVKATIGDRSIESLFDLPDMVDREKKAAITLLTAMGPPTYRSHQALWSVLCSKAVNLCLKHGNAPQVAYSHTSFGGLLGYVEEDYKTGEAFGQLALKLTAKFNNPSDLSVVYLMVGSSLRHWSKHLRHSTEDYHKAYSVGLDSGNLQYAAYAFGHNMYCRFYQGVNLEQWLSEIDGYLAFSRRRKNQWAIDMLEGGRLIARSLGVAPQEAQGEGPEPAVAAELSEDAYLASCRANRNNQIVCVYNVLKSQVLYLLGDRKGALRCSREAEQEIASVATQGLLPSAEHRFIQALILAALFDGAPREERPLVREELGAHLRKLGVWAGACPDNFLHKRLLVEAEVARIDGRVLDAVDLYDRAIEAALASDFPHNAALASELAAKLWLSRGKEKLAGPYMMDAFYGYVRWGAASKKRQLEALYPRLLAPLFDQAPRQVSARGTVNAAGSQAELDKETLVKASRVIFGDIELEKLLPNLLRITMENAGAERGFIIVAQGEELLIEAKAASPWDPITVGSAVPVKGSEELSEAIVHYVARTGEAVVLDDAASADACASDPYVAAKRPKSLLCMPAFSHKKVAAVVYLENNLSVGCFSEGRLEVLRVLLQQAGIAVENALLYARVQKATEEAQRATERLELDVARRTEELQEANQRLLEQKEELAQAKRRLEVELGERVRAEQARAELREEIIRVQSERLAELSTPIIPITDSIVVMPLIGTMDEQRARQVLETALQGAQASRAQVVILDVTGMRELGAGIASTLVSTASALRLLGTEAVLTGVRPEVAQMLIATQADLRGLVTCGTLKSGIAYAMGRTGQRHLARASRA